MIVVVPWRDEGCRFRRLAWEVCRQQWTARGIVPAEVDDGGTPFSRGGSINQAVEQLDDAEVVVVCDADLIVDMASVDEAVIVAGESSGLVQPFDRVRHLDVGWCGVEWDFGVSESTPLLGGVNVFSVATWREAGGFLEVFRGWGCEDVAFAHQCRTLVAPLRRIPGTAEHLWHPKTGDYAAVDNHEPLASVMSVSDPDELREVISALSTP